MNNDLVTLLVPVLCLGGWTWYVSSRLDKAYEEIKYMSETMSMLAQECEDLGSKKVRIIHEES